MLFPGQNVTRWWHTWTQACVPRDLGLQQSLHQLAQGLRQQLWECGGGGAHPSKASAALQGARPAGPDALHKLDVKPTERGFQWRCCCLPLPAVPHAFENKLRTSAELLEATDFLHY